ncbi:MAG: hypothetical protein WCK85_10730 [Chlorobium sp.]
MTLKTKYLSRQQRGEQVVRCAGVVRDVPGALPGGRENRANAEGDSPATYLANSS